MRFEDVKEGMWVKYYDWDNQKYYIAQIMEVGWTLDIHEQQVPKVLIADPTISGGLTCVAPGHLEPYRKTIRRVTHCWNCHRDYIDSKTMPLCDACDGIICPDCGECLCNYNR